MPETIFISYRSLDSAKVDPIVANLRSLKNEDGTPRYRIWQDKADIIPGTKGWWRQIVDAIQTCKVFVFMVSQESVKSPNCIAEVSYAKEINRHILSFVLEGEYYHDPVLGKKNIGFWDILPEELNPKRSQFLFDTGTNAFQLLINAIDDYLVNPIEDFSKSVPIPPDPRHVNEAGNNTIAIYRNAVDSAWRLDFEGAKAGFKFLANEDDPEFGTESKEWVNIINEYQIIVNLDHSPDTQYKVPPRWQNYRAKYAGKPFIRTGLFDPKDLKSRYDGDIQPQTPSNNPPPTPVRTTILSSEPKIETPPPPQIFTPPIPSFLPQPFEWCKITGGKVTLVPDDTDKKESYLKNNLTVNVSDFYMAKYPLTNAQYQVFVDARDGYNNPDWWAYSEGAKAWRKANPKPQDTAFAGDDHPRTNITWYESVAFTLWLSQKLGVNIHLPTDEQWQRAAIGDTKNIYPWGNQLDDTYANYNRNIGQTTPVTAYPKNVSPFGVMDMSGNVWEWCYTSYDKGNIPLKDAVDERKYVLRGGSWWDDDTYVLRAGVRFRDYPNSWYYSWGMRFALSQ